MNITLTADVSVAARGGSGAHNRPGDPHMNFDMSRLRKSDQIIGASAIAFFIFLFFFHWYGVSASAGPVQFSTGGTGWQVFTNSRWIWLITIIVALLAVAIRSGVLNFESPVRLSLAVTVLGALSTLLILYRIFKHPTLDIPGAHAGIKLGIWLGLIAAGALTYGGYLSMQEESTSPGGGPQQAGSVPPGTPPIAGAPDSAPAPPAAPAASTPQSTPPVPPPAAPADPGVEPGPAPPAPPAAPSEPAGPPIPPPAAPPEQP